jgi:hypothetical protein
MSAPGKAVLVAGLLLSASCLFLAQAQAPQQEQASASAATRKAIPPQGADFTGVWYPSSVNLFNFVWTDAQGHELKDLPLTAWGQQKMKEHHPVGAQYTALTSNDPDFSCLPPGVPMIYTHAFPMEVLEAPGRLIMFFEYGHYVRQIFTDGRGHSNDLGPTWMGDSIGHWEGDTLVIDSNGFTDRTWLDVTGHPHSEDMHIVERVRRPDHNTLTIDITLDDPKAYTTQLKTQRKYILKPGWNISEFICEDNGDFASFEKKVGKTEKTGEISVASGTARSIAGDWKGSATMADGRSLPATASFSSVGSAPRSSASGPAASGSSTGTIVIADPAGAVKFPFENLAVSASGTITANNSDGANFLGQLSSDGKQITGDLVLATGTGHKVTLTRR